jgi:hypothetical protein
MKEMFALSFTALFLEMMVIRWVPSVVHLVAYYANLMLLSSFLGLGAGAMAAGRRGTSSDGSPCSWPRHRDAAPRQERRARDVRRARPTSSRLPPSAFHAFVAGADLRGERPPVRAAGPADGRPLQRAAAPDGLRLGPRGSLFGTLCFGLFSLKLFSPVLGMAGVMLIYLAITGGRRWWIERPGLRRGPRRDRLERRSQGDLVPLLLHHGQPVETPMRSRSPRRRRTSSPCAIPPSTS